MAALHATPRRPPEPFSRRALLGSSLCGAAGMLLGKPPKLAAKPREQGGPPARSVIQIWMWGGPSHLDTFDPKPEAGHDYCGPFQNPIETKAPGIRINQLLPELAQQADKYSIIRGMTHGINAHETGTYLVQTGRSPGAILYPSVGAVVSHFKGYTGGYQVMIPPYVVLTQSQGRFSEAGFLGSAHKPFATGGDPAETPFAVEGIVAEGISDQRQDQRRQLLRRLDRLGIAVPNHPQLTALRRCEDEAYDLILGN